MLSCSSGPAAVAVERRCAGDVFVLFDRFLVSFFLVVLFVAMEFSFKLEMALLEKNSTALAPQNHEINKCLCIFHQYSVPPLRRLDKPAWVGCWCPELVLSCSLRSILVGQAVDQTECCTFLWPIRQRSPVLHCSA